MKTKFKRYYEYDAFILQGDIVSLRDLSSLEYSFIDENDGNRCIDTQTVRTLTEDELSTAYKGKRDLTRCLE